ncbi:dynamin family protein [Mangrovibacillus cuniculi]|uniref:Dynamin N-terminal domain-containing protein n=1 Tax=Mangrovibacillus cuniculi TaxID=2593652 RepID=A0A7S8CB14_9BACI|nr:dynamin family protein [Mangrovibacillus cuniculi]QPC46647.1 hypothetical protein G8O30_06565 [Mangrovibacillus cuniculi]
MVVKQQTSQTIEVTIKSFYQNGDTTRVQRAFELKDKFFSNEKYIAFCGHFSAGKSTVLNKILDGNWLPSSPIPTSANIVLLRNQDVEKLTFINRDSERYELPSSSFLSISELAKDGEEIVQMEISSPNIAIPKGVVVLDTPGVDSTDAAHQELTEGSLHLVDHIVYVTDYNHVLSEVNHQFLDSIQQLGIPVTFVVNQMDKHVEEEISFNEFAFGVKEMVQAYGVREDSVYFISAKNQEDFQAEWQVFEKHLKGLYKELHAQNSAELRSIKQLRDQHEEWLNVEKMQLIEERNNYTEESSLSDAEKALLENHRKVSERMEQFEKDSVNEWIKGVKDINLMPFSIRENIRSLLETYTTGFKIGFFSTKKKVKHEQDSRLVECHHLLNEETQKKLEWHVKNKLESIFDVFPETKESFRLKIDQVDFRISIQELESFCKEQADVTGEFLLQVTSQIEELIKSKVRLFIREFWVAWQENHLLVNQADLKFVNEKQKKYESKVEEFNSKITMLECKLDDHKKNKEVVLDVIVEDPRNPISMVAQHNTPSKMIGEENVLTSFELNDKENFEKVTGIEKFLQVAEQYPYLDGITNKIKDVLQEKQKKQLKIVLFGAFSAGKSSLANALLGEWFLPSSPNPMTATITSIAPPTNEFKHNTGVVKWKTEQDLVNELNSRLSRNMSTLEEWINNDLNQSSFSDDDQKFLEQFQSSITFVRDKLGQQLATTVKECHSWIAQEEKSMFVKEVTLYIQSFLSDLGVTLIDTPGADSIHARHTNVAFNYMKEADIILYVTYYHHAFAKADRAFLAQLGRVKSAFEHDKMFFLVNAIDLAESEEEKEQVISYVRKELATLGIQNPRLYGVSSLKGLRDPMSKDSGIPGVKGILTDFIQNDLASVYERALVSLVREAERLTLIEQEWSNKSKEEKQNAFIERESNMQETVNMLNEMEVSYGASVKRELHELLHYVHQRISLAMNDYFKESFNPAALKVRDKALLQEALEEWITSISFLLEEEIRATILRVEKQIKRSDQQVKDQMKMELHSTIPWYTYTWNGKKEWESPEVFADSSWWNKQELQPALRHFRSAQSFFVKGEKEKMLDELQTIGSKQVRNQLEWWENQLYNWYSRQWETSHQEWIDVLKIDINDQFMVSKQDQKTISYTQLLEVIKKMAT